MILGTALLLLTLAAPPVRADAAPTVESEIKQLELTLAGYLSHGEIDRYAQYLAEDYVRITADGRTSSKSDVLAEFRAATGPRTPLEPSHLTVRSYGDTAILNGELAIGERRSRFTKVFIRREGRWILVNNQGSPLKQPSSPRRHATARRGDPPPRYGPTTVMTPPFIE